MKKRRPYVPVTHMGEFQGFGYDAERHPTVCGNKADKDSATNDPTKVTCKDCKPKKRRVKPRGALKSLCVTWVDVTLSDRNAGGVERTKLLRDFTQWMLDENKLPIARGHSGSLGVSGGWDPKVAKEVEAWWKARIRTV